MSANVVNNMAMTGELTLVCCILFTNNGTQQQWNRTNCFFFHLNICSSHNTLMYCICIIINITVINKVTPN